jgi:hypothetical protein
MRPEVSGDRIPAQLGPDVGPFALGTRPTMAPNRPRQLSPGTGVGIWQLAVMGTPRPELSVSCEANPNAIFDCYMLFRWIVGL